MKKILFVAGITIVGLSAAFAQEVKQAAPAQAAPANVRGAVRQGQVQVSPEMAAQRRTDRLNSKLNFSDDQKKKVYDLFLKEGQANNGRVGQTPELEAKLKAVFTGEQAKQYEAMKAERMQMVEQRMQSTRSAELKSPTPVK
jgi:protein CpxP